MKRVRHSLILTLFFSLVSPKTAQAFELFPFIGHVHASAVSGCCTGFGSSTGVGVVSRWDISELESIEFDYFGSGPWNQVSAGFPYYILGQKDRFKETLDQTKALYISDSKLIVTPAVGLSTIVTKTVLYDLPVLLTTYNFNVNAQYLYSLNKDYSLVGIGQAFYIYSRNSQQWGFTIGLGIGGDF